MTDTHKKPVSQSIRNVVIRLIINEGKSQRKVADFLQIPRPTIQSIVSRYNSVGLSTPGQRGGPRRTVFTEEIRSQLHSLIDDNLTTTVEEIKRALGVNVSETTVWKRMKQEGFTYKLKRPVYQRRNDADVKASPNEYIRVYTSTSQIFVYLNIVLIDESQFNLYMFRSHSWVRR
ncbi:hypothetical protein RF11_03916 [Thelohanellus kitauei]|uniref:Transposase Tc1-like domain-containing protein n=1 Tax=Thelohanellus kitauei TaxID=669202 RepID=A0A0C2J033_THEKT|nr:hypothetical protein RF11_03916 [Thelohanellus kitauei]